MDESKWPIGFVPEPDLQGLEPLTYEPERSRRSNQSKSKQPMNRQSARREDNNIDRTRGFAERGFDPHSSGRSRPGPPNRRRVKVNVEY